MDAFAKGLDKCGTVSFKRHVALYQAIFDLGKILEGNAVGFKLFPIRNQPPDQVTGRYGQRLFDIDDGVGHDDALFADRQLAIDPPS